MNYATATAICSFTIGRRFDVLFFDESDSGRVLFLAKEERLEWPIKSEYQIEHLMPVMMCSSSSTTGARPAQGRVGLHARQRAGAVALPRPRSAARSASGKKKIKYSRIRLYHPPLDRTKVADISGWMIKPVGPNSSSKCQLYCENNQIR